MIRRVTTVAVVALLVGSMAGSAVAVTPAGAPQQASASAYSGAHISFDASENAITDYTVENATVFESVKVQSQSKTESGGMLSSDLSAVVHIDAAGLSLSSQTEASATVQANSGATLQAHDNGHGILTVKAGNEGQVVVANLSGDASAKTEDDDQVAVTTSDGTKGTFVVVGDGSVTINENGNVTAKLGQGATLVFRTYPDGKSESEDKQEQLIDDGTAAGAVYVMSQGESTVTDSVNYTSDFTVTATQSAKNEVTVTANHAKSQGKVIITSVSKQAVGTLSDIQVTVDGNAAAEVSSYSELKGAFGSDQSRYMVKQASSASASATADVLIAFNHFSERQATVSSGSAESSGDAASDAGTTTGSSPGFGLAAALIALAGAALVARRE